MTELEKCLFLIADALALPDPHPTIVYAAKYLIAEYDRCNIPDWIEALANGNMNLWEDVVDEVRQLKKAEEMENG